MLLIGDIHINAKQSRHILQAIREHIARFPDEKNILFLGDYMYMFSYDRQALADLLDLFLQLRKDGKSVYILAGNHDWLNQHFVYHEGKKVGDMLSSMTSDEQKNTVTFITTPTNIMLEQRDILFVPYNKQFLSDYYQTLIENNFVEKNNSLEGDTNSTHNIILAETLALLQSKNRNEQLSGALNAYLLENYKSDTTLIHHYYTAGIAFPGQFATFDYKDIALHPLRTQYATQIISGHLHKAFVHKNYTCVGSVWHTTSTERDQCKWLWKRLPHATETHQDTRIAQEITINPYISADASDHLTQSTLLELLEKVRTNHISIFPAHYHIHPVSQYDFGKITLILYSQKSLEDTEATLDPELKTIIADIHYKQTNTSHHADMTQLLDISQYNVQQSLLDRKELVKNYLLSRYGEDNEKYRTLLSELGIL